MRVRAGTSGWSFKEWKGSFYPEKLAAKDMLRFYGERFETVEVNNTFYRMPKEEVLAGWAEDVPAHFKFVLKASQRITHIKRLKEVAEPVEWLLKAAAALGEKRGPFLVQLPPNMKKDVQRLKDFLALMPARSVALECRHASWYDDEVYAALRERQAAWCIAETGEAGDPPFVATADWTYLRLRKVEYSAQDLAGWVAKLRGQQWAEAYVFFKHEDEGTGPKLAAQFLAQWQGPPVDGR
jgi:uncharacterized protein YecE (DUF72 family)